MRCGAAVPSFRSKTCASSISTTCNFTLLMLFWFLIADGRSLALGLACRLELPSVTNGQGPSGGGTGGRGWGKRRGGCEETGRALHSPDGGHRIMASRDYDRVSVPVFFLLFDFWGIEKHEPTGWMRMQFSCSFHSHVLYRFWQPERAVILWVVEESAFGVADAGEVESSRGRKRPSRSWRHGRQGSFAPFEIPTRYIPFRVSMCAFPTPEQDRPQRQEIE